MDNDLKSFKLEIDLIKAVSNYNQAKDRCVFWSRNMILICSIALFAVVALILTLWRVAGAP